MNSVFGPMITNLQLQGAVSFNMPHSSPVPVKNAAPVFIVDLDGTLGLLTPERLQHIEGDTKDWTAFYEACVSDHPSTAVIETVNALYNSGAIVRIFTGRKAFVLQQTLDWLKNNRVRFHSLHMRPDDVHEHDHEMKRQWLKEYQLRGEGRRVVGAFEDRASVVQMWREEGVFCFQVAEGDF